MKNLLKAVLCITVALFVLWRIEKVILQNVEVSYFNVQEDLFDCFNKVINIQPSVISIGTSVLREINFFGDQTFKRTFGLNCGSSATSVSLSFHYAKLLALLDRKTNLKEIYIGISKQDFIGTPPINIDKMGVDLFSIKSIFTLGEIGAIQKKNFFYSYKVAVKNLLFPLSRFNLFNFPVINKSIETVRNTITGYKNKTFEMKRITPEQREIFQHDVSIEHSRLYLNKIKALSKEFDFKLKFILLPENRDFTKIIINDSQKKKIGILLHEYEGDFIDLSSSVSIKGFADCCHLNDNGKVEFESFLKREYK